MTFEEIDQRTRGIRNLNSRATAQYLHNLIRSLPADPDLFACEVGTYFGYISSVMALSGIRVLTVDPMRCGFCDIAPDSRSLYLDVIQNFINTGAWTSIVPVAMKSIDALELLKVMNPRIGLLYLDGDHNYNTVIQELRGFDQFITVGGYVCGDDCTLHSNLHVLNPNINFNNCWESRQREEFEYVAHDYGAGASSAVWEFFMDNPNYEVLPNVPGNQFGFRKLA